MKRMIAVICLLAIILCGCASSQGNDPVGQKMRKMIREDYSTLLMHDLTSYTDEDLRYVCGMRYYGTYNGYIILFDHGDVCMFGEEKIGKEVFTYGYPIILYAYKDHQFHRLKYIYEQGLICDADIAAIAEKHRTFKE